MIAAEHLAKIERRAAIVGRVPGSRYGEFCAAARAAWVAGRYPDFDAAREALAPMFSDAPSTPKTPTTPKTPPSTGAPVAPPAPAKDDDDMNPITQIKNALDKGDISTARKLLEELSSDMQGIGKRLATASRGRPNPNEPRVEDMDPAMARAMGLLPPASEFHNSSTVHYPSLTAASRGK
jgi:hypothetical protein